MTDSKVELHPDLPGDALEQARRDLDDMLVRHVGGLKIDKASMQLAMDIIEQHGIWCRKQGLDFPLMTLIALPSVNRIRVHPKDLSQEAKERIVVNLCREFGSALPMEELAWAISAAWPGFRAQPHSPLERRFLK